MATRVVNSTAGQGVVLRGDGIRLYGLDAELELKAQSKRDPKYEKDLGHWIEQATGLKLEYPDDLIESLKSGIVLCTLINVLLPGTIKTINTKPIPLMQVENIGLYLKACWKVGVPSSDLFVTSDLYQRKGVLAVLQNLASIARAAPNCPAYKGPTFGGVPKPSSAAPAKKWAEIQMNQPVFVTDYEDQENISPRSNTSCNSCGLTKSCFNCDHKSAAAPVVNNNNNNDKELTNKINSLNLTIKEQENKLSQINQNLEQLRKQSNEKEKELNSTIEDQKKQLVLKENLIKTLNNTNASLLKVSTPATTVITPPISSPRSSVNLSTPSTNSQPNKNTFNAPSSSSSTAVNRFSTRLENVSCQKCNFQNSKVSKYCISCGFDLKKESTTPSSSFITPTTTTTSNTFKKPDLTPINVSSASNTTSNNNDKIESLMRTVKLQEESIQSLNKQLNDEKQSYEKKFIQQKQTIDNQQLLLKTKEQDIKKLEETNSKLKSNTTSSSSPISTTITTNTPNVGGNLSSNNNRFTVNVSAYRSTQVGPGSYINKASPSTSSPPLPSTATTNGSYINNSKDSEIEKLKELVKQLEGKLNDEVTKSKMKDSTIKTLQEKISTLQSRPTRRPVNAVASAAIGSQVITLGRKRFNTLTPDTLDNRLVETTLTYLTDILYSRPIEFYQVTSLNSLFKTEPGRRRFSQILQMTLKQLPQLTLSESSFEFLLYLISTVLQEMDVSKDCDFITAKVIFHASSSLCRINTKSGQSEYLKDFIRSASIWKNIKFWEDYFYQQLTKSHRKRYNNNIDKLDRDIVFNLLSSFSLNMINFLTLDEVKNFVNEMSTTHNLLKSDTNIILDTLSKQPTKLSTKDQSEQQKNSKDSKSSKKSKK
eukprot:gene9978-12230_t